MNEPRIRHFIHSARRSHVIRACHALYPRLPPSSYPYVFPLFNPSAIDVLVFWDIPSSNRSGFILVTGPSLGASHAPLMDTIQDLEHRKVTRSMFAETLREREEILRSIQDSEWNREVNPLIAQVTSETRLEHDFTKGYVSLIKLLQH